MTYPKQSNEPEAVSNVRAKMGDFRVVLGSSYNGLEERITITFGENGGSLLREVETPEGVYRAEWSEPKPGESTALTTLLHGVVETLSQRVSKVLSTGPGRDGHSLESYPEKSKLVESGPKDLALRILAKHVDEIHAANVAAVRAQVVQMGIPEDLVDKVFAEKLGGSATAA